MTSDKSFTITMSTFPSTRVAQEAGQTCPLCAGKSAALFTATDENHRISKTPYAYSQCSVCQAIFIVNPPADLSRYYQSNYYAIPSLEQLQKIADKDHNKINLVMRFAPTGRLLEVGPSFGVFAWQAKQAGFLVDVIEMDSGCCEFLQNTLGLNVIQSTNPSVAMQALPSHDVIAIWHVLEHLPDPLSFLHTAAENLLPGVTLVIAMPNPDAWQFGVMGKHWPHLDAPRHLTLIPAGWLERHAVQLGLEKLYLTSDDSDARSWNRFGWQRLLMNRFKSKFMQRVMFVAGYGLSLVFAIPDRMGVKGSAYTIVFRKKQVA